jgi:protoheme IX farnesyltransferase
VTRFQTSTLATIVATVALVTVGAAVRVTGSGMGCPDWPLCYNGVLPPLEDTKAWWEWIHRAIASVIGLMVLAVAFLAWKDHRDRRSILWPSLFSVLLVLFQAWLGRETVRVSNTGTSVLAHLVAAMALLGVLAFVYVRSRYAPRFDGRGGSQGFTLLAVLSAGATFGLLVFGANVTALTGAGGVFTDWPLMNGSVAPSLAPGLDDIVRSMYETHALHRYVAGIVALIVWATWIAAWRTQRSHPATYRLAVATGVLFNVQVVIGAILVLSLQNRIALVFHVAAGAITWALAVATAVTAYYDARSEGAVAVTDSTLLDPAAGAAPAESAGSPSGSRAAMLRAYVALTKPRIIELLLITTIPAMVLATRDMPAMTLPEWLRLAFWTLLCGSLAAGSANAINQYLDRDIDLLMSRTRRRPLPAHDVTPENALVFGIVLGVISIAVMAWMVNLVAAFLTLLAIAFYVVVYTILLKRTTPQNIVIGGAAGALPPVIGWAAVTGRVEVPAIILFLLVFYWTPPHFWALALRIRKDYEAARVPMLPVVKGVPETTRQIGLYTIVLVAISLLFYPLGGMGLLYLVAAIVLGGMFLWRAWVLWEQKASPEGSLAQSIRLYKYSISYLTLLFAAVAVDALIVARLAG